MNDLDAEKKSYDKQPLTKKDIINHFLLFRVGGSLVLLGILGFIADYLDRNKPDFDSDLFVGILVITIINVPIQLFYLVKAITVYQKSKKN